MVWQSTYSTAEKYLQQYPRIRKWLNQCLMCQSLGYKPEMPEEDGTHCEFKNIRFRFKCLPVDSVGLCDVCSKKGI